jgi:nucleotide-binding universal stress UspA family protein
MYRHILIAIDGSKASQRALTNGLDIAKAIGAKVTAMTVTEMWTSLDMPAKGQKRLRGPVDELAKAQRARAEELLAAAQSTADAAKVDCKTEHARDDQPAQAIVTTANARKCDLIIMGSRGNGGLGRLLLGSQVAKVLALTDKPVLVHR